MSTAQTSDNLLLFPSGDLNPVVMLEKAKSWRLESVLVLGWDSSGAFMWGGSQDDARDIAFMLDCAKFELMKRVTQ